MLVQLLGFRERALGSVYCHASEIIFRDTGGGLSAVDAEMLCKERMIGCDLFKHATPYASDGKMGISVAADAAEMEKLTQVETEKNAAVEGIGDNVGSHFGVPSS